MVLSHREHPAFEHERSAEEMDLRRGIDNPDEARDYIQKLRDAGTHPVISVPREFVETLQKEGAAKARETWIPKLAVLAGTIGVPPYSPEPNRIFYEVVNPDTRIEPRFTGKDKKFHGIVWFPQGIISIDDLRELPPAA